MATGSARVAERISGERGVAQNKWIAFLLALLVWAAVFYLFDRLIMAGQGLPVGIDLMPV